MSLSNQLFGKKSIEKFCSDIRITTKQKKFSKQWLELLDKDQLQDEKKNYLKFSKIMLEGILGYAVQDMDHESGHVEFQFADDSGKNIMCIEAKGTNTKDLFAMQHRIKKEHATPIKQTWDYMGKLDLEYGICTNYKDFVLITKSKGYSKYYLFDFTKAKDENKLKEFVGIFSKNRIINEGFIEKIHEASIIEEKEFTKEFYKLYHETRLMLIKAFSDKDVSQEDVIHYSQLFLNRLIFMFFVSDSGDIPNRLFTEQIHKVLNSDLVNEHSRLAFDRIAYLFKMMDEGHDDPKIFGFNGGLFAEDISHEVHFKDLYDPKLFSDILKHSKLKKSVKLDEYSEKIIKRYDDKLNPLISNLLIMDSFDFTTDVNVNILGHIFEQSISHLEELSGTKTSKRKKDGVYYTPEYITDYICRNTIIPYLSKSGKITDSQDLVAEYSDDIESLEKKFREIKILDPACGSGAFLVKAVDVLLEINKVIQDYKQSLGKYSIGEQFSLTRWNEESEVRAIIENNIYGVDINEESIGITRLAMFLKIASANRKLMSLSNNIKVGNSLIADKTVDSKAFVWEEEFPEILNPLIKNTGFDVVIGNPPYISTELMTKSEKDYFSKHYDGIYRKYDSSIVFVEQCFNMLKDVSYLGFIIPLTWQTGDNYPTFRKLIFNTIKSKLTHLVNLPFDVFPDAYVDTGISIFKKGNNVTKYRAYDYPKNDKINIIDFKRAELVNHKLIFEHPDLKVFPTAKTYHQTKSNHDFDELGTITNSTQGIVTSKYPVNSTKKSKTWLPFLRKGDGNRYRFQIRKTEFIDSVAIPNILDLYTQPKIMIRRIINRQNRLMAFYENTKIITNKDYNPFVLTSKDHNIFYILGLLNSKLLSYYYIKKSSLALKDDFRQTTLSEIRKFQIMRVSEKIQNKIGLKAKNLGKLNMTYFELKDQVLRRISENFLIKINKKLTNFLELDFIEFQKIIESFTKKKFSLDEQNQWENFFINSSNKLNKIKNEIISLDNELDDMIYDLHDISEDEIKLIKEKILDQKY